MRLSKHVARGASVGLLVLLDACGGGGGTAPPPPGPPAAPVVSYPQTSFTLTSDVAIAPVTPMVTGGAVTEWLVSPALPTGLTLNAANGQITGAATQSSAQTTHAVTGRNAGGSSTVNLSFTVNSGVLLELGHTNNIVAVRYHGARVLSRDGRGTWALWNAGTGERLATGSATCPTDCDHSLALGGSTAVIASAGTLEVCSADSGAALWNASIAPGTWWVLASNGSYVALGDNATLTVRGRDGTQLFQIAGDFAAARAVAADTELRLANSPAGSSVIQRVAIPGGTSSNSAGFQGSFHSWFTDGAHFLTNINDSVWVYSADGTQQGAGTLPTINALRGSGERIWIRAPGSELKLYSFGPALDEVASFTLPQFANKLEPSANTLGVIIEGGMTLGVVDLSPPVPTWTTVATPISHLSAYAAISATDPVFGNQDGVLMRDVAGSTPPQVLAHGRIRGLAGSTTRFAIGFASGDVHYYDAASRGLQGVIETAPPGGATFFYPSAGRLQLSRDGNSLAVGGFSEDDLTSYVTLYSLPSEDVLSEFAFNDPERLTDFSLSGSGEVLSFLSTTQPGSATSIAQLVHVDGTVAYLNNAHAGSAPVLAESGARGAFALAPLTATSGSRIIEDGTLAGTLPGSMVDWLDEQRLIVNRFRLDSFGLLEFDGVQIVDPQGQVLVSPALPRIDAFEVVATDDIYAPQLNAILNATTGNTTWSSTSTDSSTAARQGVVAGDNVVFTTGTQVRIEPWQ